MYYVLKNFPQLPIDDIMELIDDKYILGNTLKKNGPYRIACIPHVIANAPNEGHIEDGGLVDYDKLIVMWDTFTYQRCNLYSTEDPVPWEVTIKNWKDYMVRNNYKGWEIIEGDYDENRIPR